MKDYVVKIDDCYYTGYARPFCNMFDDTVMGPYNAEKLDRDTAVTYGTWLSSQDPEASIEIYSPRRYLMRCLNIIDDLAKSLNDKTGIQDGIINATKAAKVYLSEI